MARDETTSIAAILRRKFCSALRRLHRLLRAPEAKMTGEVTIAGTTWRLEIAMTARRRYAGLGGRAELAERTGMLFIYPDANVREFSMRGCLIPLDIAFISPSLEVVSVFTMAIEPDRAGRTQYVSARPAQYVLETPAGEMALAGVVVGSKAGLSASIPAAIWSDPSPVGSSRRRW